MANEQLIDDVKELLEKELGDSKILQQIKRACENNEAIAKTERDYVQNLKETFLAPPPPEPEPEPTEQDTTSTIEEKPIEFEQAHVTTTISTTKLGSSKNKMIGIGAGIIAVVIIATVALSGVDIDTTGVKIPSSGILLESDASSYNKGDIISISGISDPKFGNEIILSISNSQNILIWTETVKLKYSGQFSTLTIAGGGEWKNSGTYTISAEHSDKLEQTKFSFNG